VRESVRMAVHAGMQGRRVPTPGGARHLGQVLSGVRDAQHPRTAWRRYWCTTPWLQGAPIVHRHLHARGPRRLNRRLAVPIDALAGGSNGGHRDLVPRPVVGIYQDAIYAEVLDSQPARLRQFLTDTHPRGRLVRHLGRAGLIGESLRGLVAHLRLPGEGQLPHRAPEGHPTAHAHQTRIQVEAGAAREQFQRLFERGNGPSRRRSAAWVRSKRSGLVGDQHLPPVAPPLLPSMRRQSG